MTGPALQLGPRLLPFNPADLWEKLTDQGMSPELAKAQVNEHIRRAGLADAPDTLADAGQVHPALAIAGSIAQGIGRPEATLLATLGYKFAGNSTFGPDAPSWKQAFATASGEQEQFAQQAEQSLANVGTGTGAEDARFLGNVIGLAPIAVGGAMAVEKSISGAGPVLRQTMGSIERAIAPGRALNRTKLAAQATQATLKEQQLSAGISRTEQLIEQTASKMEHAESLRPSQLAKVQADKQAAEAKLQMLEERLNDPRRPAARTDAYDRMRLRTEMLRKQLELLNRRLGIHTASPEEFLGGQGFSPDVVAKILAAKKTP